MVPELYGCFAALDFFKSAEKNNGKIFHIGRSDDQEFNWSDFPPITDDVNDTKTKLGKLLRFSFAYKHVYRPSLDRNSYKKYQNETWFRRMISGEDIDLNHDNIH